ncbi:MAG: hypothetical protein LBU29_02410 [Endomicrobium sp.]|nr:hypothetical protein [Endomicrobium sp.]
MCKNEKKWQHLWNSASNPNDVAHAERLTFVCPSSKEQARSNNNWIDQIQAKEKMILLFKGVMYRRILF